MKTVNLLHLERQVVRQQENSKKTKTSAEKINANLGQNIVKSIQNLGKNLINFDPNYEPKIWERKDRFGNTYYRIYDPMRDRYIYFSSEEEVRCWLDKRYYL